MKSEKILYSNSFFFRIPIIDFWVIWTGRVAAICNIVAAAWMAVLPDPSMRWLFVLWSISNVLWVYHGIGKNSGSLVLSQSVFLLIDVIGLVHWWVF